MIVKIGPDVTLYRGNSMDLMPKLGRCGAIITDPPIKIYHSDSRLFLHHTPWLDMARAMAPTVIFTVSGEVAGEFPKPDRIVTWRWGTAETAILVYGSADLPDVFEEQWPHREAFGHGSCKPLMLLDRLVAGTSGVVFDPFMGSGTTGVACMRARRPFIGCEIDPAHFQMAERRIREAET
jgi:hypothetical protein